MLDQEDLKKINSLYSNFRSDIVAAELVDNGFDENKILLARNDGSTRETDKEIVSINLKQDNKGIDSDLLVINTNRPGIYDSLPEALFHSSIGLGNNSKERIIEFIRKQHKEELFIRKFFSLYEVEIDRVRINISRSEFEYDRPSKHRSFVSVFERMWGIIKQMDSQTAILFIQIIPYIAEIRNRYDKISQAISMIMGYDISLKIQIRKVVIDTKLPRLGIMKLGINSVLKGEACERYALIKIDTPQNAIKDLLPQRSKRKIVESLLEVFLPANISYEIVINPKKEAYTSRLGEKYTPCILGVNAKLM